MTTDNDVLNAIDQVLDERSLEWAAQWIEGSLKGEPDQRVREFGKNMAMTLRAAKSSAPVVSDGDDEGEGEDDLKLSPIITHYVTVPIGDPVCHGFYRRSTNVEDVDCAACLEAIQQRRNMDLGRWLE